MGNQQEHIDQEVAAQLRMEIARRNLTHKEVAETSGIPLRTLSRYLNAERSLKVPTLMSICSAIGVSITDILNATEQQLE